MTLEEFFEKLKTEITTDYIVKLKYKYDFEEEYTYSNEILTTDINLDYVWLNDWNEGQTDIEVLEYIAVDNVRENIHGEWIKTNPLTDTVECSLCHYQIISEELITPFCPWCGADMRERKETDGN